MTTPRIEEMVEEFENIFVYDYELSEGFERPVGSEPSFRKEVKAEHMGDVLRLVREGKDWLRTALTEAYQAGFNDALQTLLDSEEMKENKIPPNTVATTDEEDAEIWGYNSAITAIREKITSLMHTKQAE